MTRLLLKVVGLLRWKQKSLRQIPQPLRSFFKTLRSLYLVKIEFSESKNRLQTTLNAEKHKLQATYFTSIRGNIPPKSFSSFSNFGGILPLPRHISCRMFVSLLAQINNYKHFLKEKT